MALPLKERLPDYVERFNAGRPGSPQNVDDGS